MKKIYELRIVRKSDFWAGKVRILNYFVVIPSLYLAILTLPPEILFLYLAILFIYSVFATKKALSIEFLAILRKKSELHG